MNKLKSNEDVGSLLALFVAKSNSSHARLAAMWGKEIAVCEMTWS